MRVYRLEFHQPDGRWTGPYCAEWMTERAFDIRAEMIAAHTEDDVKRPWPDPRIFLANPGPDRYICGTLTEAALREWFGRWFDPLMSEGGHIGAYDLSASAPVLMDGAQVIYMQRQAVLHNRFGYPTDHLEVIQRIHPSNGRAPKASLEEEADRALGPMTVVDDPHNPPWGNDRSCPDCGEPDLPLKDSKPPGLTFISHCGGSWIRGPMKMPNRAGREG